MLIRNDAPGMRGVQTEDQGLVMLLPGETRDLKVSEGDLNSARRIAGLVFDADEPERRGADAPNAESTSETARSTAPATLHPMPPGQDITRPEQVLESGAVVAPWAMGGGPGSAAQTADQLPNGETSAADTAKAQENETLVNQQPPAPEPVGEDGTKQRRAPREKS